MHFLPQGSPLSHRSHASRERLKVTIKSPPPPAPPCSLSLLPSHSHSPSGRLRTVQILCHPLLTAPFAGNLDVPSWLPRWERSLPFPLVECPRSSSPLELSARYPPRATLACRLVASVGVLVASPPPGGTYDSSDWRRRLSLSQACLALFSVAVLCISF